jgi:hypothetical protein
MKTRISFPNPAFFMRPLRFDVWVANFKFGQIPGSFLEFAPFAFGLEKRI